MEVEGLPGCRTRPTPISDQHGCASAAGPCSFPRMREVAVPELARSGDVISKNTLADSTAQIGAALQAGDLWVPVNEA
jgi:hypothetical protein